MDPEYSIITTCKGRLHHLRRSLPSFLKQPDCEVIVVDYSCPDNTQDYVRKHHPAARVVSVPGMQGFSVTHARNIGAREAKGKVLAFLDADVVIADDFVAQIRQRVTAGKYGVLEAADQLRGCCVVTVADYDKVGGYDEALHGYVAEDLEFCARLWLAKCEKVVLDPELITESIVHSDAERVRFYDSGTRLGYVEGNIYRLMKGMMLKQTGGFELELSDRQDLFACIRKLVRDPKAFGEQGISVEVHLPPPKESFVQNCEFTRKLVVGAKLRK